MNMMREPLAVLTLASAERHESALRPLFMRRCSSTCRVGGCWWKQTEEGLAPGARKVGAPSISIAASRVGGCLPARARHGWRKNMIESNAMRLS